jgi:uncharacterized RDD family membrane protein YckC
MPYAGFWRRVLAYIVDGIILSIAVFLLDAVTGGALFADLQGTAGRDGAAMAMRAEMSTLGFLVTALGSWLYAAGFEASSLQATPGKLTAGAKVTDLEGERIGFGRATGRFFAKILSGAILMIGFIMVGFTAKKQGLHDTIAGTLVIKRAFEPSSAGRPNPPPPPHLE